MPAEDLLIILDLDETLVYSTETPLDRDADFRAGEFHTYKRPHVSDFLDGLHEIAHVAVWTSSSPAYADQIVDGIFPAGYKLEFVWARNRCTLRRDLESDTYVWHKNLKKVRKPGYRLERTLMIDNSPEKLRFNYGNAVYVHSWFGEPEDDELMWLSRYLMKIKDAPNFRAMEKRYWRRDVERDLT